MATKHPLVNDTLEYNAGKFAAPRSSQYDGVDSKLRDILEETQRRLGVRVDVTPSGGAVRGRRSSTSQHVRGNAVDIQLYYPDGKPIPNYQNASAFPYYQKFANTARAVQQEKYPELDNQFRWGGYFGGGPNKYGALDLMHFDLGGSNMAGGSWEKGLTQQQASIWGLEPGIAPGAQYSAQPEWAKNVDNSNPVRPVAYAPEVPPLPRMVPRISKTMPPTEAPLAPPSFQPATPAPPSFQPATPAPPSFQPATPAPPTYQTASLAPDMPASMAPWNRTTATEVMPTVPKPASWDTSFPPQTNRQAQQDIISQMSPDWQQRAAQLGLGTAPPRTTPNVQIANVDPMVNQAADIYRQTMGVEMPSYLDAARESATYRPANMPSYTPARMVPDSAPRMVPDSTPSSPTIWNQTPSAFPKANMVPDTPARMVSDTPARQTAWDAPVPPSPFDQVASIAQPSIAAPARVSAPPTPPMPDAQTAWETWNTGGARIVPADGAFNLPSMPAPLSTPPAPTTRTVTEQVLNPEWQKWMDLQTAYPEAEGILAGLGPDTYLRTSRAEPNKYIVRNNQVVERQPVPPMPNTQLPFPNGVPPTRSPTQQFADKIFSGLAAIGGGNMGAIGGLFGNMAMRSMLPIQSQTVGQNYGGYIPSKIYNTPTFNLLSGGSKYPYSVGTNVATGQSSGQYTVQKDDGSSVTYGTDSWPDSFSAPPNSTMYEVSWS